MAHDELRQKFDYDVAIRDCEEKLSNWESRLKAEFDEAMEDRREPFTIQPLTQIRAHLVYLAIQKIQSPIPEGLKEIVRVQSRSCGPRRGPASPTGAREILPNNELVALNSDQLYAILQAAGLARKELVVAPVQG